ncbi:MAG TPA: imidazolonepropionase, partial [Polyangiaceae bacterium]
MTASGGPHQADLLVVNAAQLVTCAGFSSAPARGPAQSELGIIQNGALAIQGDRLAAVGTTEQVCSRFQSDEVLDAGGSVVLPGFVDPHTHLVFAGDRADEWEAQLRGESYLEIARRGGGILRTVSSTRAATFEELLAGARRWAELMLRHGTTCFEAKSGYCLDLEGEMKLLRVARGLPAETNQKVCSTLLAAHVVPPEYENDREEYLKLCERALERARGEDLVDFADVFCEAEAFTLEEAERILQHAKAHGVGVKLHAEQFSATGAATLGARLGAVSVDHLDALRSSSLREFAAIEPAPIAVLLPAAAFHLGVSQAAPARALIEAGV